MSKTELLIRLCIFVLNLQVEGENGYNEHEIAEYKQYLNLIAWRDAQIKKLNLVPATSRIDKAA